MKTKKLKKPCKLIKTFVKVFFKKLFIIVFRFIGGFYFGFGGVVFTKKLRLQKCVGACLKVAPHTSEKFGFLKYHFCETFFELFFFDLNDFKGFLKKPSKKFTRVFMVFFGFYKN